MRSQEGRSWNSWLVWDSFPNADEFRSADRWSPRIVIASLLAIVVGAGCAGTKITSRNEIVTGKIARPATIWVYDFVATPSDMSPHSALTGVTSEHSRPQSPEEIATGRKLGAIMATELVERILFMGMPAKHGGVGTQPQINDIEIRGYILSYHKGEETERVAVGFGHGAADVRAAVEGFQVTSTGLRKLGAGSLDAEDSKTPGVAIGAATMLATANPLGLVVSTAVKTHGEVTGSSTAEGRARAAADEIADQLKIRFRQQGWIE